jgi:hypothetical protein
MWEFSRCSLGKQREPNSEGGEIWVLWIAPLKSNACSLKKQAFRIHFENEF